MTDVTWLGSAGGPFGTGPAWSGGQVPTVGDDAILPAFKGTPYTVTLNEGGEHVTGLQTAPNATFSISDSSGIAVDNGTDGGVSAGVIDISNGSLDFGGAFDNAGKMNYAHGNSILEASDASFTGGGLIFVSGSSVWGDDSSYPNLTLTNVDNRVFGSGDLSIGSAFTNGADGIISSKGNQALSIEVGFPFVNEGRIRGQGAGGLSIVDGPIENDGELITLGHDLTVAEAVTGTGTGVVAGGVLAFQSSFSQNVRFAVENPGGVLSLAQSQGYGGAITGFSHTGATALDLEDIGFVSANEATLTNGVLTVTDGTDTARIHMNGVFGRTAFIAASDGHGGTLVTASVASAAELNRFIEAVASLAPAPHATPTPAPDALAQIPLLAPHGG